MRELKNILVPTDFSDNSYSALLYAIDIADMCSARLSILHSYRLIPFRGQLMEKDVRSFKKKLEKDIQAKFEQISSSVLKEKPYDINCSAHVGFTEDSIESYITSEPVDLIVMGALGESEGQKTLGSTLTAVVKSTSTPVLAIPPGISFGYWSRVLLTKNLYDTHPITKTIVQSIIDKFPSQPEQIEFDGKNANQLISHEEYNLNDLYAMGINEYNALESLFNKPVKKEPKRKLTNPLLIAQGANV